MSEQVRFCPYCGGDLEMRIVPTADGKGLEAQCFPELEPDPEGLVHAICQRLDVSVVKLRARGRERHIVDCRRIVARQLRRAGLTLTEIGRILGKRDHTTIINLLNTDNRNTEARLRRNFGNVNRLVDEWRIDALTGVDESP